MKYRSRNPKVIALIIEIVLLFLSALTLLILDSVGVSISFIPVIIAFGVLLFALILTLSLIRYDSLRSIRKDFKETNLPLYTDSTTLMGHDIKDEEDK